MRLPKVSTRKEFMDVLHNMMAPATEEPTEEDLEEERRGHPRELKSYLIESNGKLQPQFADEKFKGSIDPTGLDDIKILHLSTGNRTANFFLDMGTDRFWVLHTNDLAENAFPLVKRFVRFPEFQLDQAWIPAQLLESITRKPSNRFEGFGLEYEDKFALDEEERAPIEELTVNVSGANAPEALEQLRNGPALQRAISYNKVRIERGEKGRSATDDITLWGAFNVKGGASIDDHISLIQSTSSQYAQVVKEVESHRLATKGEQDALSLEGQAFSLVFERRIENLDLFVNRLFSSEEPFRLWGIKSQARDGYCQVNAIDLHTGHPLDLEITSGLIRAYLPDQTCGNSLLRLYVNLQHYFDARVECAEISV